jgi:hypothetical protein
MRLLAIGLLIGSITVAACGRTESPASAGNTLAAPAAAGDAAPQRDTARAPGADAGASAASGVGTSAARPATLREVTIPAGTSLPVVLETSVGSDTSRVEESVQAHLARAIMVEGVTALPEGSLVSGVVTDATRSGKVKGRARVALRFDSVSPRGQDERYRIQTSSVDRVAASTKKEDTVKILAPAAGGALIGRIAGGRKGAAIGTAAGAGAGTAFVMSTRGKEVRLAKGTALTLKLAEPITVRVRG